MYSFSLSGSIRLKNGIWWNSFWTQILLLQDAMYTHGAEQQKQTWCCFWSSQCIAPLYCLLDIASVCVLCIQTNQLQQYSKENCLELEVSQVYNNMYNIFIHIYSTSIMIKMSVVRQEQIDIIEVWSYDYDIVWEHVFTYHT